MQTQIKTIKAELNARNENLATEKVLKSVIAYYSKLEDEKAINNIDRLR